MLSAKNSLAAIVLAKNEAETLSKCLLSLKFCDLVVVVDDYSSDETAKVAKKYGAKVYQHPLSGDFSAQRNWAISQIKYPWLLYVDADEVIPKKLAQEILSAVNKQECIGYLIPRLDYLWGREIKHGDAGSTKLVRLGRRGMGYWKGKVHETWELRGKIGCLHNPILHYPHPKYVDFLRHINFYSTLKAADFYSRGRSTNILEIILGPLVRFFQHYLIKLGFLDGTVGFIHAMTMSFYTFLVAGKLYLLGKGIPKAGK